MGDNPLKINRIVLALITAIFFSAPAFANSFTGTYRIMLCKGQFYSQDFKQPPQSLDSLKVQVKADQTQFVIQLMGPQPVLELYTVGRHLSSPPGGGFILTKGTYVQNGNLFRYFMGDSTDGSFIIKDTFSAKIAGNSLYLSDVHGASDQSFTCLLNRIN